MSIEHAARGPELIPPLRTPVGLRLVTERPSEPRTFEELLRAYGRDLQTFVGRRVRDSELARDVVQETLLRAYRARRAFDADKPVWPWLATIARNLILNTQRDERRRRKFVQAQLDLNEIEKHADPAAEVDPEKSYSTGQRRAAIAEALASLTPRQRRVLMLRAADDFSYGDIAHFEGISTDAVKSLLKRARCAFREVYSLLEPEPEVPSVARSPRCHRRSGSDGVTPIRN